MTACVNCAKFKGCDLSSPNVNECADYKETLTNEEWLRTLPADERVKEILSRDFMTEKRTAEEFVEWLKEMHHAN